MNAATPFNSELARKNGDPESVASLEPIPSLSGRPTFTLPTRADESFRLGNLTGAALPVASVLFFIIGVGIMILQPMFAAFALAFLCLVGAPLIAIRHRRDLTQSIIARRVEALMLAHKTYHAEGRAAQTANDNEQQYSIQHRFISSHRIG